MDNTQVTQMGAFALVSYLIIWFTRIAYPQAVLTLGAALATGIDRTLAKIDGIEQRCTDERRSLAEVFKLEMAEARRLYREDLATSRMRRDAERDVALDMLHRLERTIIAALGKPADSDTAPTVG